MCSIDLVSKQYVKHLLQESQVMGYISASCEVNKRLYARVYDLVDPV